VAKGVGAIAPTLQLYPKVYGRGAKNPKVEEYLMND